MEVSNESILMFGLFIIVTPMFVFRFALWKIPNKWSKFKLKDWLRGFEILAWLGLFHLSIFGLMYFGYRS